MDLWNLNISITFCNHENHNKLNIQPQISSPSSQVWLVNLVDVLPLLLPGRWEHHLGPPQLLNDHQHLLSLALLPQLLCHQRPSKHHRHRRRRAQGCSDRWLQPLRKSPYQDESGL
jgi:hypothetical protein